MRRIGFVSVVAALAGVMAAGAAAAPSVTRHVSTAGSDSGKCVSSPCRTIQHAVDVSGAGDTISVAAGTYGESVTVTVRLKLVGSGATIDASGYHNGIVVSGAAASGTSVRGSGSECRPRGHLRGRPRPHHDCEQRRQ